MELIYEVDGTVNRALALFTEVQARLPQIFIDKVATRLYTDS